MSNVILCYPGPDDTRIVHTVVWLYIDSLWSALHPSSWYYNMFVKESLTRTWKVKPKIVEATESVIGSKRSPDDLEKAFSKKSTQIKKNIFKVILDV